MTHLNIFGKDATEHFEPFFFLSMKVKRILMLLFAIKFQKEFMNLASKSHFDDNG